jgi:hypothetical protein
MTEPPAQVPLLVYVRIQKIFMPQAPRSRLTIYQALRPDDSGIYAPLSRLKEPDMYGCATILVLRTIPSRSTQLSFVISEFRQEVGDVEYARLVLPLVWFRVNRIVSYSYPLITRVTETEPPMMLLDVHLTHGSTAPFAAPHASLKVVPTWEVPPAMRPPEVPPNGREDVQPPMGAAKEADYGGKSPIASVIPPEVDSWLDANREARPE